MLVKLFLVVQLLLSPAYEIYQLKLNQVEVMEVCVGFKCGKG